MKVHAIAIDGLDLISSQIIQMVCEAAASKRGGPDKVIDLAMSLLGILPSADGALILVPTVETARRIFELIETKSRDNGDIYLTCALASLLGLLQLSAAMIREAKTVGGDRGRN